MMSIGPTWFGDLLIKTYFPWQYHYYEWNQQFIFETLLLYKQTNTPTRVNKNKYKNVSIYALR